MCACVVSLCCFPLPFTEVWITTHLLSSFPSTWLMNTLSQQALASLFGQTLINKWKNPWTLMNKSSNTVKEETLKCTGVLVDWEHYIRGVYCSVLSHTYSGCAVMRRQRESKIWWTLKPEMKECENRVWKSETCQSVRVPILRCQLVHRSTQPLHRIGPFVWGRVCERTCVCTTAAFGLHAVLCDADLHNTLKTCETCRGSENTARPTRF